MSTENLTQVAAVLLVVANVLMAIQHFRDIMTNKRRDDEDRR